MAKRMENEVCPIAGSRVPSANRREKETRRSDILEKLRKSYSCENNWWWFCEGYCADRGIRETMLRAPALPMQLSVEFGAGVIKRYAHSSW